MKQNKTKRIYHTCNNCTFEHDGVCLNGYENCVGNNKFKPKPEPEKATIFYVYFCPAVNNYKEKKCKIDQSCGNNKTSKYCNKKYLVIDPTVSK